MPGPLALAFGLQAGASIVGGLFGRSAAKKKAKAARAMAQYNANVARVNATTIRVNVGQSMNGGFVAPLEMEFVGSILENSTT